MDAQLQQEGTVDEAYVLVRMTEEQSFEVGDMFKEVSREGTALTLESLETAPLRLRCPATYTQKVSGRQIGLLRALPSSAQRYQAVRNGLATVRKAEMYAVCTTVAVTLDGAGSGSLPGLIRFVGETNVYRPGRIMFGVELLTLTPRGDSDGSLYGQRYFQCGHNCGVFVSFLKLEFFRSNAEFERKVISHCGGSTAKLQQIKEEIREHLSNLTLGHLKVGMKVVVFNNKQKEYYGTVRWLGRAEAPIVDQETLSVRDLAGIELDVKNFTGVMGVPTSRHQFATQNGGKKIYLPIGAVMPAAVYEDGKEQWVEPPLLPPPPPPNEKRIDDKKDGDEKNKLDGVSPLSSLEFWLTNSFNHATRAGRAGRTPMKQPNCSQVSIPKAGIASMLLVKNEDESEEDEKEAILLQQKERIRELEASLAKAKEDQVALDAVNQGLGDRLATAEAEATKQDEKLHDFDENIVGLTEELSLKTESLRVLSAENDRLANEYESRRQENERLRKIIHDTEGELEAKVYLLSFAEREKLELQGKLDSFDKPLHIAIGQVNVTETTIGKGSFADVFFGTWKGVPVAVKTYYPEVYSPYNKKLFKQEVALSSRLRHPNIVQMLGATWLDDCPVQTVMELLESPMSRLLLSARQVGYLTLREQLDLAEGTCCGISYMHTMSPKPCLHCDIKSSNVLITREMIAKVGDFGAAHYVEALMSAGVLSVNYLAPERLGSNAGSTIASDVYSLGVTITELFSGEAACRENKYQQLGSISDLRLQEICHRAVAESPEERPSAAELQAMIQERKDREDYVSCPPRRIVMSNLKRDGVVWLQVKTC